MHPPLHLHNTHAQRQFDTNLIPEAVRLYDAVGVRKAPLTLIPPKLEAPLPPLQPAVYPPLLRRAPGRAPAPTRAATAVGRG